MTLGPSFLWICSNKWSLTPWICPLLLHTIKTCNGRQLVKIGYLRRLDTLLGQFGKKDLHVRKYNEC